MLKHELTYHRSYKERKYTFKCSCNNLTIEYEDYPNWIKTDYKTFFKYCYSKAFIHFANHLIDVNKHHKLVLCLKKKLNFTMKLIFFLLDNKLKICQA